MTKKKLATPGVYIEEKDAFGNAVVAVPTAIPVFIGYTEKTTYNGNNLINKAVRIESLAEFLTIFGEQPPQVQFNISNTSTTAIQLDDEADFKIKNDEYWMNPTTVNYRLYSGIQFFYENGGGTCYIMSIGVYDYSNSVLNDTTGFMNALQLLEQEVDPTLLVIPDLIEIKDPIATNLQDKYANAYSLQNEMINHCGKMMTRVAILDIPGGYCEPLSGPTTVEQFRTSVEPLQQKYLSYAAAYYPWLHTTVNQVSQVSYKNIRADSYAKLKALLEQEFTGQDGNIDPSVVSYISAFGSAPADDGALDKADAVLKNKSLSYQLVMKSILTHLNLMAPSAAMAGIYNAVDQNSGVWQAPANVAVQGVVATAIKISYEDQEDLNVPLDGKSICAIRTFKGLGIMVWGARTLDGNSNDWRYVNVRRTLIFLEQSMKQATKAYIFEPNNASTWASVQSMLSNFLTGIWKQGGLVGPVPADAFSVSVGLGSTMTGQDILNGIMNVSVRVAVSHPAEFIEISFQQEMQSS